MRIFTKDSLENLRNRIDLIDVISGYVDMKQSGSTVKGLCPFHDEKTPSFVIRRGDSHYHCFGCGAHGDAIEFLMSHQKLSFVDAVTHLSEKFHVILEQTEERGKSHDKRKLKEALEKASKFYHFLLLHTKEGNKALEYLFERGITLDFIKNFEIGFSSKDIYLFQNSMKKQNIDFFALEEAGLVKKRGSKFFDFFSNRLMIPVRDFTGSVIGFSARKIDEKSFGPKYINSQETPLFKKSKILFGLSFSRRRIAKEKRAIIVEGQLDALSLIYEGITITVAGQGTAFGKDHVNELLKLGVNKVYLALDGDKAGVLASMKIGDLFQKNAVEVYVAELGDGMDPDKFLKFHGVKEFIECVKKSPDYLSFLVKEKSKQFNISSPSGKNEMVKSIVDSIKKWDHPLMVHESVKKIAALTNTPESSLGINQDNSPNIYVKKSASIYFENINPDRVLEADLLRWLILVSDSGSRFLEISKLNLEENDFKIDVCKRLFQKYMKTFEEDNKVDLLSIAIDLDDMQEQLFLSEILQKKINREKAEEGFLETVQKILDRRWMQDRERIKLKIQSGSLSEKDTLEMVKEFDRIKNDRPMVRVSKEGCEGGQ